MRSDLVKKPVRSRVKGPSGTSRPAPPFTSPQEAQIPAWPGFTIVQAASNAAWQWNGIWRRRTRGFAVSGKTGIAATDDWRAGVVDNDLVPPTELDSHGWVDRVRTNMHRHAIPRFGNSRR
jgi:hypothetical protein